MKRLTAIFLATIMFLIPTLTACEQNDYEIPYVVLSRANVVLSVGDVYTVGAKVYPESSSGFEIEWTTSNPDVVTCEGGRLVARSAGSSVIKASVSGGNAFSATVKVNENGGNHINMFVGESFTVPESEYKNVFDGEFYCASSDESVATLEDGVITATSAGNALIRVYQGTDCVTLYSVSVFNDIEAMVNVSAPEMPLSLSYMSGKTVVEVQEFSYTLEEYANAGTEGILVTLKVKYKKIADIDGDQAKNKTGFYIELYSDEVGYCTTYDVGNDRLCVGEAAEFSQNFIADVSGGMRHFNINLLPIEG